MNSFPSEYFTVPEQYAFAEYFGDMEGKGIIEILEYPYISEEAVEAKRVATSRQDLWIAIDDFGSGFSNLQHIISLQSDCIKIDGSIVRKCCESIGAENMIALISTWKSLTDKSIKIVAEYVENEDIQGKVLAYDIDYSQGYLFSKPSPDIKVD